MNTIIFDHNCPMCRLYTKAFVATGLLDKGGRISFEEVDNSDIIKAIDWNRAKDEIPFVELHNKKVYYGAEALLRILGKKFSFFNWLSQKKLLVEILRKLYFFISYNRRVIIPGNSESSARSSAPHFNSTYRTIYILFAWLVTSTILYNYSEHIQSLVGSSNMVREFLICGGQIVFQFAFLFMMKKDKAQIFEYTGNMLSISLAGSLLLLPMMFAGMFIDKMPAEAYAFYFMLVAGLMFAEHMRRMYKTGLPSILSLTWVVYRILILFTRLYI